MSPEEFLFEQNRHLAKDTLYKMFNINTIVKLYGIDKEDLFQYSLTGLWKGILSYEEGKSKLQTHLINHIKWHVLERLHRECNIMKLHSNEKRENLKMYKFISLDETFDGEGNSIVLHDAIPSDTNVESKAMSNIESTYIWNILDDREREIINLKEIGLNNREIGELFNLTRAMIGHIVRELRKKLINLEVEVV